MFVDDSRGKPSSVSFEIPMMEKHSALNQRQIYFRFACFRLTREALAENIVALISEYFQIIQIFL